MSEAKFTPGPWAKSIRNNNDAMVTFHGVIIGNVFVDIPTPNEKFDTNLIAAAPELYEALEEFIEAYCRAGCDLTREERIEDRKRLIKARAALKKARGES